MKTALTAFAAALFVMSVSCGPAGADDGVAEVLREVKVGALYHDMDSMWSGFRREDGIDANLEFIFATDWEVLGGSVNPALGGSLNTSGGETSKAYLDMRWEIEGGWGGFFALGLGGAIHNGDLTLQSRNRKALGSRVLFHIPAEVGVRLWDHHALSVYFDHVSNAWLAEPNEGMDTLGVRYGYRF